MEIINNQGEILEHIYFTGDRWDEDINFFVNAEFKFSVFEESPIDLMEKVCAHLLYWYFESQKGNSQAKEIYEKHISKNKILQRINQNDNPIPELVIYEFNGTSIYDDLNGEEIISNEDLTSFKFDLKEKGQFLISREEFGEMGGEINLPEDEEDEIEIEFYSSDVYFFMTESDQKSLGAYMRLCISELNGIYETLELPTIRFKPKKIKKKRVYVEITESWADGCACSTIKISRRQWAKILNGENYERSTTAYYDGQRSYVDWFFKKAKLTINGDACNSHVEDLDVKYLTVYIVGGD